MKRILIATCAVLGTVASIGWFVIPDLINAISRSRSKRTMADIRAIAGAWEARAESQKSYSVGIVPKGRVSREQRVSYSELAAALTPTYIHSLPRNDAWGNEYQFTTAEYDDSGRAQSYAIRSLGSDALPDRRAIAQGESESLTADIIYADGSFIQYPHGAG
ncbi:MAG TPA: hypothetical protein VGJ82_16935 [Thermoanaerobaculia bacterium]|jgi:hypothetical protein